MKPPGSRCGGDYGAPTTTWSWRWRLTRRGTKTRWAWRSAPSRTPRTTLAPFDSESYEHPFESSSIQRFGPAGAPRDSAALPWRGEIRTGPRGVRDLGTSLVFRP